VDKWYEAIRTEEAAFATQVMFVTAPIIAAVATNPPPTITPPTAHPSTIIPPTVLKRHTALFSVMLVSSDVIHVMRSSKLVWDVYVCLFQQVEAQGMEWLENLQTRGVVTQRC